MIKVLHSELEFITGGIESFLMNISSQTDTTYIHFSFLLNGKNESVQNRLEALNCTVYPIPNKLIKYIFFIIKLLRENKFDIVHLHKNSALNILLPILVKFTSKSKIIIHSHNTQPNYNNPIMIGLHYINRPVMRCLSDYNLACSELAAEWLFGKNYVKKNPVEIVNNGIIVEDYCFNKETRNRLRDKLNIKNKFVIGHIGAFRKQKNHVFLIDLLAKIDDNNYLLMLLGDGPLMHEIQSYAKEKGIYDQILFMGTRSDVNELLQVIDVLVMPSLWEGLPISAIEAQAAGLPVILSDRVSKMSRISNFVHFLSLDDIDVWIDSIKSIRTVFVRKDVSDEIINAGFEIKSSVRYLEQLYKMLCGI